MSLRGEDLLALGLHLVDDPADILHPVGGLAEAHKHQLLVLAQIMALNGGQHLLFGRLPLEPEVMGIDAAAGALVVPQAKFAVEIAAVGGIDIQVVPVFIRNGKAFFHVFPSSLYRRFPFSRVIRAISSGITPFQAARVSST